MNLVKWENNQITISPEALQIKAFKDLWNKDKSKDKEIAKQELGIIYFMYDPRSEYQYETDLEERLAIIKEQTGIDSSWEISPVFENAVEVYKYLTHTTAASILESNRIAVKTIRTVVESPLEELDLDAQKKVEYVDKLAGLVAKANKLAEEIAKAEKEIHKDVEEHSAKMRGTRTLSLGDAGLDSLF